MLECVAHLIHHVDPQRTHHQRIRPFPILQQQRGFQDKASHPVFGVHGLSDGLCFSDEGIVEVDLAEGVDVESGVDGFDGALGFQSTGSNGSVGRVG